MKDTRNNVQKKKDQIRNAFQDALNHMEAILKWTDIMYNGLEYFQGKDISTTAKQAKGIRAMQQSIDRIQDVIDKESEELADAWADAHTVGKA